MKTTYSFDDLGDGLTFALSNDYDIDEACDHDLEFVVEPT